MTRVHQLIVVALLSPMLGACELPEGDLTTPTGCYYQWVHARVDGSSDRAWQILSERDQKALDDWYQAEKETFRRIELLYPEKAIAAEAKAAVATAKEKGALAGAMLQVAALNSIDKKAALEAIDYGVRAKLGDGKALLSHLMNQSRAEPLSLMETIGARVRSVEVSGTRATVLTWAGDAFDFEAAQATSGHLWRLALGGEERRGLDAAVKQAQDNQKIVEGNLVAIQGGLPELP